MKKTNFCLLGVAFLLSVSAFAQVGTGYSPLYNYMDESQPILELLDMLGRDYTYENPVYLNPPSTTQTYNRTEDIPTFSSSTLISRLQHIPSVIPLEYNQYVHRYIEVYTVEKRERVAQMLGLTQVYFPIMEQELDRQKMPMELKYLTIVESALNPRARSRAGATGLWQFMLGTAQQYGLRVDSYIDERQDPYKSTAAAIQYLKKSHEVFGDWLLAIASYNCGPNNVKKAIIRAGGVHNFWAIREYLPAETRGYVPAYIAAVYAFNYAQEHNIQPIATDFRIQQDSLHILNMDISLYNISQETGVDLDILRNLNPELKLDIVPYSSTTPYILRVPYKVSEYFSYHGAELLEKYGRKTYQYSSYAATSPTVTVKEYPATSSTSASEPAVVTYSNPAPEPSLSNMSYYIDENGSIVYYASDQQGNVYKATPSSSGFSFENTGSPTEIDGDKGHAVTSSKTVKPAAPKTTPSTSAYKYHKVVSGDTLWDIGKKYGVSVEQLKRLNGAGASKLNPGERIRVK